MAWFVYNPEGIAYVSASPWMVEQMRVRAERGARFAEQISPVRTGLYRASFRVRYGLKDGRAWARLENTVEYAVFLEFGTRYMRAQRVLGRSMDAIRA